MQKFLVFTGHSSCALHVMFSMFIVFIFIIFIVRYFCISDSNLFFWHCMQSFCGSVSIHFIYAIFFKLIIVCINTFSFIIGFYLFTVIFIAFLAYFIHNYIFFLY